MSPDNNISESVAKTTNEFQPQVLKPHEKRIEERITTGWEKMETQNRVPYYLSCLTERTSWDHPLYAKMMEDLGDFNNIRFAAYRTAMKLRYLQQKLNLDLITIDKVRSIFQQHGCPQGEDPLLNCHDLNEILRDLFTGCKHARLDDTTRIRSTDLIQNLVLNLYDRQRRGVVHAISVKTALAAMCGGQLGEKYKYFYEEISDPSTFIDCTVLSSFLVALMRIPDLILEGNAYGGLNSTPALESCLQMSDCKYGISEDMFYAWLYKEPQTLVWLPTLHRVAATETVKHDAKCSICKDWPIIGFRYRCLKCFNFDMCQQCFFLGKTKGKHKLKHPLKEFCAVASTKQDMKAFLVTMRNNFSKKHRHKRRVKYLPVDNCNSSCGSDTASTSTRRSTMHEDQVSHLTLSHGSESASSAPARLCSSSSREQSDKTRQTSSKSLQTDCVHVTVASVHSKESRTPSPTELAAVQQVQELQKIIQDLESENRNLYRQLAEIRDTGTDSCSSLSYGEEIEMEKELVEAKKEVVDDHNLRLNKQLTRVHDMLKNGAIPENGKTTALNNKINQNGVTYKNGFTAPNGYHIQNGFKTPNGLHTTNGYKPSNGFTPINGLNGLKTQNGFLPQNGIITQNGHDLTNGFHTQNEFNFSNGFHFQNGNNQQNGWVNTMNTMNNIDHSPYPTLLNTSRLTSTPDVGKYFDQSTIDSTHKLDMSTMYTSINTATEAEQEMDKLVKKLEKAFPQNLSCTDEDDVLSETSSTKSDSGLTSSCSSLSSNPSTVIAKTMKETTSTDTENISPSKISSYTMSDLSAANDDILQNVDGVGTAMANLINRVAPVQPAM